MKYTKQDISIYSQFHQNVMICGSESIDLYYLKYYTDRSTQNKSLESVRSNNHDLQQSTSFGKASIANFYSPTYTSLSDTVAGTFNMLIVRLAIGLSLVGWRVKPDPGD